MTLLKMIKTRLGFSLIEVNMAIFVLAGGALALMALFPMGLRFSREAQSEMHITAFAERFINSAQVAAQDPDVKTIDDLANALEGSPYNFTLLDDPGQHNDVNVQKDQESGVYYRAWIIEDDNYPGYQMGKKEVAQIGVQVTAENAKQNRRAIQRAPIYSARITLDGKN